jgi:hypothetical protein
VLPGTPLHGEPGDVSVRSFTGKEPQFGFRQAPPLPQHFQQFGGEHDIAVFLSLALLDPNAMR